MWKRIIDNCITHIWEWFVLLVPTLISIILTWYPFNNSYISSKIFVTIIIILFITLAFVVKLLITIVNIISINYVGLPKLKTIHQNYLIFEPSELFASQMVVSLYYKNTVEQFIGYGTIDTVTSDKKMIQVVITEYMANWDEKLVKRNKDKIILKPSIPKYILEKVGNYE